MSKSIKNIKREAKQRVNNHFGDAFIIVFVPFFIMNGFKGFAYSLVFRLSLLAIFQRMCQF